MKKAIAIFALCLLLLCITACGNGSKVKFENTIEFASSEEMLNHLAGMWVVEDDAEEKSYYIFQDGQVCIVTDGLYSNQVKNMLNSALQNSGLEGLYIQDFANISKRMYLSDVSTTADSVTMYPQNGEIILYEGDYGEKSIVVTEEAVMLAPKGEDRTFAMTKISDTADFSLEQFRQLYNQVIDSHQIPASYILMDPEEYGEMVKKILKDFDPMMWKETRLDGNSVVYETIPDWATTGRLLISNKEVDLNYTLNVESWYWNETTSSLESMYPNLKLYYKPENPGVGAMKSGESDVNITPLIQYCLYAVKDYPGAYTDPVALYSDMVEKGKSTTSAFDTTTTYKSGGLEYSLTVGPTKTSAFFCIYIDDTVSLKDIMSVAEENENSGTQYSPLQSGTLEQLLDGSKSWVGLWEYEGWEYRVHYVFEEDGNCYFALSSETELYSAGVGTYTVKDGNTLSLTVKMNGEKKSVAYAFNPEEFSLTVTSKEGLVAQKGEVFYLQENTDNDAEQVIGWGEMFKNGLSEDNELWGE